MPNTQPPRIMQRLSDELRARHYSPRTEKAYCGWVRRYIHFHGRRHPAQMGEREINEFLTHLAVVDKVAPSTQNQALAALLFLYRHVFGREVGDIGNVIRARRPRKAPVVLTREEVRADPRRARRGDVARGLAHVRDGPASHGVPAPARAGCRLRTQRDHGALGQGRQGPSDDAARGACRATRATSSRGRRRSTRRTWPRAGGGSSCRRHSTASTRGRQPHGAGSGSSRSGAGGRTRAPAIRGATTFTRRSCSGR